MSTPEHREVARLLLEKASEDLSAKALIAEDQADHVIGFHFQQAASRRCMSPFDDLLGEERTERELRRVALATACRPTPPTC